MTFLAADPFLLPCENGYCPNCDTSAYVEVPVQVNELYFRYSCGWCGALDPKLHLTDYGWELQDYLLSGSQWDEGLMPLYDGTYK